MQEAAAHLDIVGGEIGGASRVPMHSRGHPDVHGSEPGSSNGDDIQQTEVTEGGNERHQQRERAPHVRPPTATCTHTPGVRRKALFQGSKLRDQDLHR